MCLKQYSIRGYYMKHLYLQIITKILLTVFTVHLEGIKINNEILDIQKFINNSIEERFKPELCLGNSYFRNTNQCL